MKRIFLVDFVLFSVASFFLLIGSYPDVFMKDYSLTASGILIAGVLPLVLGLVLLVLVFLLEWKKGSPTKLFPGLAVVSQAIYLGLFCFLFDSSSWDILYYGFWIVLLFLFLLIGMTVPFWKRAKEAKNRSQQKA